ncbi:reverse transcriptase [Gossypium australe]|uniref:Reverse transcriptase n=1 Tax=Gossypium australe TaxID=47621 RepID=A0A5B6WSU8_9ROSI|nr:reverse transcriptase [Gossypium australe]
MKKMGFIENWTGKIMSCVWSTLLFLRGVSVKGTLYPLNCFYSMLIHPQNKKSLRGIRDNRPRVNHLFFADDALLFLKNKKSDIESLINILKVFADVSG